MSGIRIIEREPRILDFDIETVAAGFADPQWVPQKITCIAFSWVGDDVVYTDTCGGSAGLYERPQQRRYLLQNFCKALDEADIVTGHNLIRFDLPVLNAECMRLGIPRLRPIKVQDTMKLGRVKGFKKGLDNIAGLLKTYEAKQSMDWQQWEDAYAEKGWPQVIARCRSDVVLHKQVRKAYEEAGWPTPVVWWRP